MNGSAIQVLIVGLVVGISVLLIMSSRRKAATQKRIASALEKLADEKQRP